MWELILMLLSVLIFFVIIIALLYLFYHHVDVVKKYGLTACNSIKSTVTMYPGMTIKAGIATLIMQDDGNLVLYDNYGAPQPIGKVLGYTGTAGKGYSATLDSMGRLHVMNKNGTIIWTGPNVSGSNGTWYLMINSDSTLSLISPNGVKHPYTISPNG